MAKCYAVCNNVLKPSSQTVTETIIVSTVKQIRYTNYEVLSKHIVVMNGIFERPLFVSRILFSSILTDLQKI